jgi:beta-galactosidase
MRTESFGYQLFGVMLASAVIMGLVSCSASPVTGAKTTEPQKMLLDAGWLFHRGEVPDTNQVAMASYDDRQWQTVNLPHDYVLDGTYDSKGDRGHGYLPITTAWYRRHVFIPRADEGKSLELDFGGIFSDSEVWLNGQLLGTHRSGYTEFAYDIRPAVRYGADNVITVHVDPRRLEGWWYEGGGIYRHVYLNVRDRLHVVNYGVQVTSVVPHGNEGADDEADLTLQTTVTNEAPALANFEVWSEIIGPDGNSLVTDKAARIVAAGGRGQALQQAVIMKPQLWSPDSPRLYQLRTTVVQDGRAVDTRTTTFGIRTIYFDADKGFFLNGKHVEIQGVACHQDFPAVGIAVPDSLQEWRVRQLKKSGANGWRTAHNPPNDAVLDACDRLGMLVMDENRHLGNTYNHHSPAGTVFTNADDLATMIQRDRNHPSIIMWSMCNEEPLQGKPEGARIFSAMMKVVHEYDRTRPITCAMNAGWLKPVGIADVEDLIGVNYNDKSYDAIHKAHPGKPMFGSEMGNSKTARSVYEDDRTNGWVTSYNLTDIPWQAIADRPNMAGCYIWTGFDYRGEPNPNGWPDVSNNTGLLDNCGFPKDKFYYLKSWWSDEPMVHLMPVSWNWPGKEGQNIRVIVFSNARQVELFLNDKSLGRQTMPRNGHLEWEVPYTPGRLVAKGFTDGKLMASDMVETVGAPARLVLSPERQTLHADGSDTVVVPVSVLDARGRFVADASNRVSFQLTGGGRLLGVGNGNPGDHDPDRANQRNAFNGHCITLIQAGGQPATLELMASSPGLAPARMTFKVR